MNRGPLSALLNAGLLQFYLGGVFDPPFCDPSDLDHAVLLVGFGTEDSLFDKKPYWCQFYPFNYHPQKRKKKSSTFTFILHGHLNYFQVREEQLGSELGRGRILQDQARSRYLRDQHVCHFRHHMNDVITVSAVKFLHVSLTPSSSSTTATPALISGSLSSTDSTGASTSTTAASRARSNTA